MRWNGVMMTSGLQRPLTCSVSVYRSIWPLIQNNKHTHASVWMNTDTHIKNVYTRWRVGDGVWFAQLTSDEDDCDGDVMVILPSTQLVEKKAMLRVSRGLSWVQSGDLVWGSDSPVRDELSTWTEREKNIWWVRERGRERQRATSFDALC